MAVNYQHFHHVSPTPLNLIEPDLSLAAAAVIHDTHVQLSTVIETCFSQHPHRQARVQALQAHRHRSLLAAPPSLLYEREIALRPSVTASRDNKAEEDLMEVRRVPASNIQHVGSCQVK